MTRRLEVDGIGFRFDGRPFDLWGIRLANAREMVVNVGVFYQARIRQLADERAVLRAARETARWLMGKGYRNIFVDLVNEYGHGGFQSMPLCFGRADRCAPDGGEELIAAFKEAAPTIPVAISADSRRPVIFDGSDLVLIHFPYPPGAFATRPGVTCRSCSTSGATALMARAVHGRMGDRLRLKEDDSCGTS